MAKQSPNESPTPPKPGDLVKPPHGKGFLRHGSLPGTNAGGTGRPPSAIRERLRGSFEERIAILEEIADGAQQAAADRMKAIDLLGKYGLGTTKELTVEHVKDRLQQTIRAIYEVLPKEQADAVLTRIEPLWR